MAKRLKINIIVFAVAVNIGGDRFQTLISLFRQQHFPWVTDFGWSQATEVDVVVGDQDDRVDDNDDDGLHANDENDVDNDDENRGGDLLLLYEKMTGRIMLTS